MTDRISRLTVILERDVRDDDIVPLLGAIRQMRGVLRVEQHVADPGELLAYARVGHEWTDKLLALIKEMQH